jgi:branched-chain amino acid transport system ATP-binding protein
MYFAVSDMSVDRGPIRVLKSVSLEVDQKEIVSLIGANGAGKTTLLLTIVGLLKPLKGGIFLDSTPMQGQSPDRVLKAGIALCPAERHVFARMTVRENLLMGAYTRRSKAEIAQDFEKVFTYFPRLKERQNQAGGTLSGGEQQMLAMARSVMGSPQMLLLDEPSLGLAPIMIEELAHLIEHLNRDGTTVLLVEQNAMLALEISKRTYVMELGKIVMQGDSKDLAQNDDVRKAFLGE